MFTCLSAMTTKRDIEIPNKQKSQRDQKQRINQTRTTLNSKAKPQEQTIIHKHQPKNKVKTQITTPLTAAQPLSSRWRPYHCRLSHISTERELATFIFSTKAALFDNVDGLSVTLMDCGVFDELMVT